MTMGGIDPKLGSQTFEQWLRDLVDHLVSRRGYSANEAKAYVTDQPECWREFFNDGYTPADAAFEDATS